MAMVRFGVLTESWCSFSAYRGRREEQRAGRDKMKSDDRMVAGFWILERCQRRRSGSWRWYTQLLGIVVSRLLCKHMDRVMPAFGWSDWPYSYSGRGAGTETIPQKPRLRPFRRAILFLRLRLQSLNDRNILLITDLPLRCLHFYISGGEKQPGLSPMPAHYLIQSFQGPPRVIR